MKSTLHRYLLSHNLIYLGLCLVTCLGIYLLIDVFERLDRFLEKGAELKTIVLYFIVKTPLIVSQIFPAVLLLALLVQLSIMQRDREIVALEAGGVPYTKCVLFFVLYALLWSGFQFCFSQFLGVPGEARSEAIWDNLDRKETSQEEVLTSVWVREKRYLIHMKRVWPLSQRASEVTIVKLSPDFSGIESVWLAQGLRKGDSNWKLHDVQLMNPHDFLFQKHKDVVLAVNLDLETLLTTRLYEDYEKMPFWQLSKRIDTLRQSGSNVETLVTAWHMKLSYAFTVVVMILIGLVVARMLENIYLNISLGLCLTFLFYHLYVLGGTLGENGVVPPWLGAWLAHCVFGVPALLLLLRKQGFKRSLF